MDASGVTFEPSYMHARNPAEKMRVIASVISQAPAGAASATVM